MAIDSSFPIRILCVFCCLDKGGAESMCMNLYRNIDRDKIQFDFVKHTKEKGAFEDEIIALGGKIYEAPKYRFFNHYIYTQWWKTFLDRHPEYRVVHGHYYTISRVYLGISKRLGRITIAHSHSTNVKGKGIIRLLKQHYVNGITTVSDYCIACSEEAGKWMFKDRQFFILKNAIDTSMFTYNRDKEKTMKKQFSFEGKLVITHIGSFSSVKNQTFVVDFFNLLHQHNSAAFLVLVGGGDKKSVLQKVNEFQITDSVLFTGVRDDVNDLLLASDVFVLPSLYEGIPLVAVEAQASGLKCLISDRVSKDVDITGRCSFLSIVSPEEWCNAILSLDTSKINTDKYIIESGYSIKESVCWLQDFYFSTINKTNK